MSGPTSANYIFLPWVRQGAASSIPTTDPIKAPIKPGVARLSVGLSVNDRPEVERVVRLYGPGDVKGIDPRQVVRTEPRHLATDFEPNYFPAIEFDRPEFPWLFTPARSGENERLRPWLCLVVVRKQEGVALRADAALPLPVLDINSPAQPDNELPDLSESWAWAHAQVTGSGSDDDSLNDALGGDPALTVSRLLCPRRLDPLTDYLACVVPAFKVGLLAGLGEAVTTADEEQLEPAWEAGAGAVSLPVYYHWEFRTGASEDFEALVNLLETRKMPAEVGKRPLDISRPGFEVTPAPPPLELEGALRTADAEAAPWPDTSREPFQTALKQLLDAPSQAGGAGSPEPLLAPPVYGEWHAARHTVDLPPAPPNVTQWLDELNLDPRHRAAAALGTQVVQSQQEQLMASAWEQLGEIERVNQLLRQAQLARAVTGALHARHFSRFSDEMLLTVIAPARSRVLVNDIAPAGDSAPTRMLLSRSISASFLPSKAVSSPTRRLTRARGAINARFGQTARPAGIVATLNATSVVAFQRPEAGLVTANTVAAQIPALAPVVNITLSDIGNAPPHNQFRVFPEGAPTPRQPGGPGQTDNNIAQAFRNAVKAEQDYVASTFITFMVALGPPVDKAAARRELLHSVRPEKTIEARVVPRVLGRRSVPGRADPLEPIMDAPEFKQPMYEGLRDLSQDFLFPGLEHVPPNTVTLLESNPKFVESFMVGLNSEMGRELLWRNYPTDQRGTYFKHFWGATDDDGNPQPDIESIVGWDASELGKNVLGGEKLVLLIRGELLRRYPNTVIYVARAKTAQNSLGIEIDPDGEELYPVFRGTLKPDVTFLGFDFTEEQALAGDGFLFVIQQQPTEPRFGLDAPDYAKTQPPALTKWDDLNWRHFAEPEAELKKLSHAPGEFELNFSDQAEWGRNSAHQAFITLQRPVRIAIRAKDMLPKR